MQREREDWLWENRAAINAENKRLREKYLKLKDEITAIREPLEEIIKILKKLEKRK